MRYDYFKIPLQLGDVTQGKELTTCDLMESINKNLELIIITRFGEHRSDPSFGCEIWDLDFELIVSTKMWEEKLRHSLHRSVTTHEQRISISDVTVAVTDMEKINLFKQFTEIKKRVDIHVSGIIHKTGEPFTFHTNLFLSPVSLD